MMLDQAEDFINQARVAAAAYNEDPTNPALHVKAAVALVRAKQAFVAYLDAHPEAAAANESLLSKLREKGF